MSAYERRHGVEFLGLQLPFGCEVRFRTHTKMLKSMHKFAPRTLPGVFLGWHMHPGGIWSGDYLVAALDDLLSGQGHVRVFRIKEVVPPEEMRQATGADLDAWILAAQAEHDKFVAQEAVITASAEDIRMYKHRPLPMLNVW